MSSGRRVAGVGDASYCCVDIKGKRNVLIRSMAGDFEISIKTFEIKNGKLVMVGTMGVWDARTYFTPREVFATLAKLFRPRILFYMLQIPFLAFTAKPNQPVPIDED